MIEYKELPMYKYKKLLIITNKLDKNANKLLKLITNYYADGEIVNKIIILNIEIMNLKLKIKNKLIEGE